MIFICIDPSYCQDTNTSRNYHSKWQASINRLGQIGFYLEVIMIEAKVRLAIKPQEWKLISFIGFGGSAGIDAVKKLRDIKKLWKNAKKLKKLRWLLDGRRKHMKMIQAIKDSEKLEKIFQLKEFVEGVASHAEEDDWEDINGCFNGDYPEFEGTPNEIGIGLASANLRLIVADVNFKTLFFARNGSAEFDNINWPSWFSSNPYDWFDILPGIEGSSGIGEWKFMPLIEHVQVVIDKIIKKLDEIIHELDSLIGETPEASEVNNPGKCEIPKPFDPQNPVLPIGERHIVLPSDPLILPPGLLQPIKK